MSKSKLRGDYDAAQPLLPAVNLVRCLAELDEFCKCTCDGCPPWEHSVRDCRSACARRLVPPTCNTGVHESSKRGASERESSCERTQGPSVE
jgi:hypothetical protein